MRIFITLILLSVSLIVHSQNDVLLIYIDASESGSKLIQIQQDVNKLVESRKGSEVYLFISNGSSPIVTNDKNEVAKQLRKLRMVTITAPDYLKDVRFLNNAILENNYISNINNITIDNGLDNQFEIHFWFNEEDYNSLSLNKKMVDPILFSNKLKFNNNKQKNCTAILHLSNDSDSNKIITYE